MHTLRGRLILSHVLPILLLVPLVGAALAYLLETQVLLADLSDRLLDQATMAANLARQQPLVWSDAGEAQRFVTGYTIRSASWVVLYDPRGSLLASSRPELDGQAGQPGQAPGLPAALTGEQQVQVAYVQGLRVVQALVPVVGADQEIMGVVQMSQRISDLGDQITRLRYLVAAVLGAALLLGVIIGLALALNLGRSLRRVTDAIHGVASGRKWTMLPEQGPEEIRTLLAAFNALIEQLRVMEESRRRLLANLVHELGRPIGSLQSAVQALLGGADEDAVLRHELLEGMDTQVQRLHPLLDSLTDLHDQVLGTLELQLQPIALADWLRRTVMPWRQAAHDAGLHWKIDIPDTLPVIEIDPDRLAQVVGNLLSNAIKYTPEGTVSVEARVHDGAVAIVVGDTGIGIAPSEQTRIFEPFYRSQRDKRFPQGMGLGLSIARDLVVAHGGRLHVESQSENGSRFIILLPLQAAQDSSTSSS
jgi:two-component system sensor histidine kinase BaeS